MKIQEILLRAQVTKLSDELKNKNRELKDSQIKLFANTMEQALIELRIGDEQTSDWSRVRRAIHLLESELKWYKENTNEGDNDD